MRGEDFAIVEVNGIGGEAIDVWDPHLPVGEAYRRLLAQQRLLFRSASATARAALRRRRRASSSGS